MLSANVERVHGYLVPNSCMQIVSCTCRTVAYVTIDANASNMASATLEHANKHVAFLYKVKQR